MSNQHLMSFLNFDAPELNANRSGRISEKQKARLAKGEKATKGGAIVMGVFLLMIALVGPAIAVGMAVWVGRENLPLTIGFGVGFGLLWPLAYAFMGLIYMRRAFLKMDLQVKKAEGSVNIVKVVRRNYDASTQTHSEYSVYELHVGGRIIEVAAALSGYMMQGDIYAVYFADFGPNGKPQILSVEQLANAGAAYVPQPVSTSDDAEVVEYLKKGDLLRAIKAHRAIHNSSFEEARSAVEEIKARLV